MKVKCPSCEEVTELDVNEFEEGDDFTCTECGATHIIEVKNGKFRLISEKEKFFEEIEDEIPFEEE
jgi:predicted RNA-binding Zn-ribbon protein involved in translation (DUF1610 family)